MSKTLLFAVILTLAFAVSVEACQWVLFGMYQDASRPDGYWWKPIRTMKSGEECRALVKAATKRQIVGIIQWYHFPYDPATAPAWLKEIMAAKPEGGAAPWVGCLPSDYDPYERR